MGIIFLSFLLLEMMYQYILFQIFYKLSLFLFFNDVYALHSTKKPQAEATKFHIYGKKIAQIKPSD